MLHNDENLTMPDFTKEANQAAATHNANPAIATRGAIVSRDGGILNAGGEAAAGRRLAAQAAGINPHVAHWMTGRRGALLGAGLGAASALVEGGDDDESAAEKALRRGVQFGALGGLAGYAGKRLYVNPKIAPHEDQARAAVRQARGNETYRQALNKHMADNPQDLAGGIARGQQAQADHAHIAAQIHGYGHGQELTNANLQHLLGHNAANRDATLAALRRGHVNVPEAMRANLDHISRARELGLNENAVHFVAGMHLDPTNRDQYLQSAVNHARAVHNHTNPNLPRGMTADQVADRRRALVSHLGGEVGHGDYTAGQHQNILNNLQSGTQQGAYFLNPGAQNGQHHNVNWGQNEVNALRAALQTNNVNDINALRQRFGNAPAALADFDALVNAHTNRIRGNRTAFASHPDPFFLPALLNIVGF